MKGFSLSASETHKSALNRIEQTTLAKFLGQYGFDCETEWEVYIDNKFYCKAHSEFESENWHMIGEAPYSACPKCHVPCEIMAYSLDVFLLKYNTEIAINGGVHDRVGQQKKDAKRAEYLKSKGIDSIPFDVGTFLDSKGEPRYDRIESLAKLLSKVAK